MISVIVAAAAFTPPSLRASAPGMSAASKSLPPAQQRSFRRAKLLDIFESVSEKEIVNVLGRWQSYKQWDTVGSLKEMDRLFDDKWQPKKPLPVAYPSFFNSRKAVSSEYKASVKAFEAKGTSFKGETQTYGVGQKNDPRPTPQRRGWAKRNSQVQRYWHAENVGLLPFTSKPLAASLGFTVAEMNALPISPRACDVVFDALSRSQSGITEDEFCDERRAAWQATDGSFDAAAFESDLNAGRRTVASAYFLFPGLPFIMSNLVWYSPKVNGLQLTKDFVEQQSVMMAENAEMWAEVLNK
jgi:hypothetical protein